MTGASRLSRRNLLAMIGTTAGSAAMYHAMTTLGFAQESPFRGEPRLSGAPKGSSVLILGAGLAGMVAALELRKAGYKVQILEYREKAGGRCWTLRGGDTYTELGGFKQECRFDQGLYLNPGPWRIPYHHHAVLHYAAKLGVKMEPFTQVNHNAYVHSAKAFGGKPKRLREVNSDFNGHVAELLSKSTSQGALDQSVTQEDREKLLAALKGWGALDHDYRYVAGGETSERRGYAVDPGGGAVAPPKPSEPMALQDLVRSTLWRHLSTGALYEFQQSLFQPVGGMDMIAKAFERDVGKLITYNAKVTEIDQDAKGVTVRYVDAQKAGAVRTARADWCLCTLPFSILSQVKTRVSSKMQGAIDALPYTASVKVGLQFKRRFWEQDDHIYGGISYTDLPNTLISYPSTDYFSKGKGVVLGAYSWEAWAYEFTSLPPAERIKKALEYGAQIHPQYLKEFDNGVAVGWHRVPWTLGCYGDWTDALRKEHYDAAAAIDGRIAMAGEHISYLPGWQEGAILSELDAITRLHQRAVAS
ncbi:flavin-dependent L-tryptophan oxidase RebO precursor [Variibacter gotjawalensis]|uniref:Tryptophan 2-monooxygenase n=1 Tax=Variibacter gotjawalensis TaxID=1333996 RepID=A0A0S3PQH8_9BRAD|nr:flavin monoamine oxidase family protein [Variibacter gotjawalensis]NIK48481.1 monoamine oxidase [Variibacter gotjawalensis]RZS50348.1 monoamine oxidase [Variibacter gotjawalensis]BAT58181.1 flavin-dependent L-tryptophan oxidase RebO precursor [Variibacter gotjawalensis]